MFSKLTSPHATTSSEVHSSGRLPAAKLARKSIYRISMKTTYSTFWPKTWKLCLACRSDLPLLLFSSVCSWAKVWQRSFINAYLEAYLMS